MLMLVWSIWMLTRDELDVPQDRRAKLTWDELACLEMKEQVI